MHWILRSYLALVFFILVLACPTGSLSYTGEIKKDPSGVIEKYLSLDKRGARLSAHSQHVLLPFVIWTEEPVWGRIVVISQYHVIDDATQWQPISDVEVLIPVTFDILGTMHLETATFLPEAYTHLQHFHVKAIDERWRIIAPQFPPHVGRKRLVNFVRLAQLQEQQESRRLMLERLQKDLTQAR